MKRRRLTFIPVRKLTLATTYFVVDWILYYLKKNKKIIVLLDRTVFKKFLVVASY